MIQCPCGSETHYLACCGRYIENQETPNTPESLMRSRYTAYSQANIGYIKKTMSGKSLEGFDAAEAERWAKQATWIGLRIIKSYLDPKRQDVGYVEFIASYQMQGENQTIHELSQFQRHEGKWFYTDGTHLKTPLPPKKPKISRNAPCPCGSQKKYKNCHGKV
ncbi:YchJ family protein [Legionella micdadei]|uniref:Putative SEC-C motif domain protein n=1 Tax=Legionella micdadei TaxID=451 RepID=A0A098GI09_LEGMI|nr:YchJ family protein [Legionella micdadei]ARG96974.1 preprotein translocase subunit SecA [Legionella micdadei]KTD26685.1 putative SEC-C motif domain protein [Legionella micdadei]NSL19490.1 YchJ family protein [Legionella micdadei]CEG61617.1 putative SEC-C motif domain protein [Legionella micdadei]SCY47284.1 SEC-C motif-containing protein [Legionella micdadei]